MSVLDFIGSKATSVRNRIVDQVWERRLRIDTCGNHEIHLPDSHLYGTFAYASILKILNRLDWRSDDVFVDIGCGKGRVLCCAALFPGRKVVGIDLDEWLCEIARNNVQRMRRRKVPIEVVHLRAQEFDYRECTKFFLFNPFGAATLKLVMNSINDSLQTNPRSIQLVYLNPVHDDVLENSPGVERFDRWRRRTWGGLKHDVSFWKSG